MTATYTRAPSSASCRGRAWRPSAGGRTRPNFKPHMSRVQEHVAEFSPTELEVMQTVEGGGG
ncbi:MAG TPA: hypothetical protein VK920_11970 [Solirubrobacterales bacterium]|nr:hypothetical protein [Solirubrobacterales bacterium]